MTSSFVLFSRPFKKGQIANFKLCYQLVPIKLLHSDNVAKEALDTRSKNMVQQKCLYNKVVSRIWPVNHSLLTSALNYNSFTDKILHEGLLETSTFSGTENVLNNC